MQRFFIGLLIGLAFWPIAALSYLRFGHPPVTVTDPAFPMEAQIVHVPLGRRATQDMPKSVPMEATEANLEAGAQVYSMNCSGCHGILHQASPMAKHMYPGAPQLLEPHGSHGVVGVSDDPAQRTYWTVSNGIRLTGMPEFRHLLSDTEMWQVSLLLANADKPLSPAVQATLAKP